MLVAFLVMPAAAQRVPIASNDELIGLSARDAAIEARVDGDLNGDGQVDTAFIERGDDKRALHVIVPYRGEVDMGHDPVGEYLLDSSPLGPAELSINRGTLVVKDLTGGTSALSATYRYRWDAAAKKLRLIGLDAMWYSRTFQHDAYDVSWNLLTGDVVMHTSHLKPAGTPGDEAYDRIVEHRCKRPTRPLYLDTTPDPSGLIERKACPRG